MKHVIDVDAADSLRSLALETAKKFKSSWVELGRVLYAVWKDKRYKEWGYQQFDTYVVKEVGIRKQTSLKLLRSYYFLEKEEPAYLQEEYVANAPAVQVPSYETIDLLRKAKEKNVDKEDYQKLKEDIFVKGKDPIEVRRDLTTLIREREEYTPEEAWQRKKETNIKRFIGTLKSLKREMEESKLLPEAVAREVNSLIKRLEAQL